MRFALSALFVLVLVLPAMATPTPVPAGSASAAPASPVAEPSASPSGSPATPGQDEAVRLQSEWSKRLDAAEGQMRGGHALEGKDRDLTSLQAWYETHKEALRKVPRYSALMPRQAVMQIRLAHLMAVRGLVAAEEAVSQGNLGKVESANVHFVRADALAASAAAALGATDARVLDLMSYILHTRKKAKKKIAQALRNAPSGAAGKLHPYIVETFHTWVKNLALDEEVLAGKAPLGHKVMVLEMEARWFEAHLQDLRRHPDFALRVRKQRAQLLSLAELEGKLAVERAETGVRTMDPRCFDQTTGAEQPLRMADLIVERCIRELAPDPAAAAAARAAVKAARGAVARAVDEFARKPAAVFHVPAETYGGSDSARLQRAVVARWKASHPTDSVVLVRFVDAVWSDADGYAILLGYVVTRGTAEVGTAYPVRLRRQDATGKIAVDVAPNDSGLPSHGLLLRDLR